MTKPFTTLLSPMINRPSGVNVGQPLPTNFFSLRAAAGSIDDITAFNRSRARLNRLSPAIFNHNVLHDSAGSDAHAHLLGLVPVRLRDALRRHPAIGCAPKHPFDP